jgi:hypothetical protein
MRDFELYQAVLGLPAPWSVADVELDVKGKQMSDVRRRIYFLPSCVEWGTGPAWHCLRVGRARRRGSMRSIRSRDSNCEVIIFTPDSGSTNPLRVFGNHRKPAKGDVRQMPLAPPRSKRHHCCRAGRASALPHRDPGKSSSRTCPATRTTRSASV